ncbi:hypothetical protein MPNT_10140 [Candidatus Methylacidithermus pantelleriae]|uniref:Uncharacterized protein n=1 Tax=Candidatus Methylacidithermus pantelleriae TaxID=2744239 RepID=A0A8J2BM42_9BACT|nr:hypothetical protein MPNT_10140 [Candidatus Methylacidithermus pantelleriae]
MKIPSSEKIALGEGKMPVGKPKTLARAGLLGSLFGPAGSREFLGRRSLLTGRCPKSFTLASRDSLPNLEMETRLFGFSCAVSLVVERSLHTREVIGSSPIPRRPCPNPGCEQFSQPDRAGIEKRTTATYA